MKLEGESAYFFTGISQIISVNLLVSMMKILLNPGTELNQGLLKKWDEFEVMFYVMRVIGEFPSNRSRVRNCHDHARGARLPEVPLPVHLPDALPIRHQSQLDPNRKYFARYLRLQKTFFLFEQLFPMHRILLACQAKALLCETLRAAPAGA